MKRMLPATGLMPRTFLFPRNLLNHKASFFGAFFSLFLLLNARPAKAQLSFSTTALPAGMDFNGAGVGTVQVADINGDGFPDIIYTTSVGGPLVYLQNNGGGSFSTPAVNPFAAYISATPAGTTFNTAASIADFDGDGDLDIWIRVNGASNDVYLENVNGTYVTATVLPGMEFTGAGVGTVQVADINQDGFPDIIYTTSSGGPLVYLQNNGGTSFSTPATNPFASYTAATPAGTLFNTAASIADFDGDGDLDIWVRVSGTSNDVYLQNNNGTYVTGAVLPGMEFTPAGTGTVQVADLNGDGLSDIIYTTSSGGSLVYLQNNGGSSFSTPSPNPFASFTAATPAGTLFNTAASIADYDGDGDLDIWVRVSSTNDDVLLTASGSAPLFASTVPANRSTGISVSSNIVLNFSENIFTGAGSFYVRQSSDNSIVETIAANGPRVAGSGTTAITIDPVSDLAASTSYYITFDRNALADADGVIAGHLDPVLKVRMPETTSNFLQFTTSGALPVTLLNFSASPQNGDVLLKWETATEINTRDFTIQHSTDALDWNAIAVVPAEGNSNVLRHYEFLDKAPSSGNKYYRIAETDMDGKIQLSDIRLVKRASLTMPVLYPNPAAAVTYVMMGEPGTTIVSIYNFKGQKVYKKVSSESLIKLSIGNLPAGIYNLILVRDGKKFNKTLIHE